MNKGLKIFIWLCAIGVFLFIAGIASLFGMYAYSAKLQEDAVTFAQSQTTIQQVIKQYGEPDISMLFTDEMPPSGPFPDKRGIEVGTNEHAYCFFIKKLIPMRALLVVTDTSGNILRTKPYNP